MIERDFDGGVARRGSFEKNPNSVWICGCNGSERPCRKPDRTLAMLIAPGG